MGSHVKPTVILVNPKMCSPRAVRLPLSLLALAAVLEENYRVEIVDGNLDRQAAATVIDLAASRPEVVAVGITVMPGPQVGPAIDVSSSVRAAHPDIPIVWGGFFPTLYPDAAINAPYVDFVVRGQGEHTLLELLRRLPDTGPPPVLERSGGVSSVTDPGAVADVRGLTWKRQGEIVHNPDREFNSPDDFPPFPYDRLRDGDAYFRPSFLGSRTAVHQAAIGCRYRCGFCGVASMFNGHTTLQGPDRLALAMETLQRRFGADAVQFYDHNFFDREDTSIEALRVMARFGMSWWCYARTDALAKFSSATWGLVRSSGLRMAFMGAEAASDGVLKSMKKGTRVEHTLEVARRCRENGVIPEFSFVLGGPEDPEGEIEKTFAFIKRLKTMNPECEVILYFYSPTPQRERAVVRADASAVAHPRSSELWAGRPDPAHDARGVDRTAMGRLCLSSGRSVAHPEDSSAGAGFRQGSLLPFSDRPGCLDAEMGEERPARPGVVALCQRALGQPLGTGPGEALHPAARTAEGEYLVHPATIDGGIRAPMHRSCLHFTLSEYNEYSSVAKCRQEGASAPSIAHPNRGGVH